MDSRLHHCENPLLLRPRPWKQRLEQINHGFTPMDTDLKLTTSLTRSVNRQVSETTFKPVWICVHPWLNCCLLVE
jgi:hypothetical protein